jgi:hypothetical protein
MGVTIKQLADGQLPSSVGDLYTVPANKQTIVNTITFVNVHTADISVNLYSKKSGGTARNIIPKDLEMEPGDQMIFDDEINLEAGGKLQADATIADKVDYIISGMEKT